MKGKRSTKVVDTSTWKNSMSICSLVTVAVIVLGIAILLGISNQLKNTSSKLPWWKTSIIYQIYPRSFKDSDGDGIGDIKGIVSKLDYFVYLNVKALWLSPFYESPMVDFGYDISNFTNVDPIFGSLEDIDNLIAEAHARGIKIIIDFVPNHTSNRHVWFEKSVQGEGQYKNYFIWTDGIADSDGSRKPPNNWLSVFAGSAWTWNEERHQFYYHSFLKEQPDLDYRNPAVIEDMADVLRYWLKRGVDGIRVDALQQLFEVTDLSKNEPTSGSKEYREDQYEYLDHPYTESQPETYTIVRGWKEVMNEFEQKDGISRFMVIETYENSSQKNIYYENGAVPYNFDLITYVTSECGGLCVRDILENEYANLPTEAWPAFALGNHDRKRVATRLGHDYVNVFNMLLLTLWGTPTTYYGEELGMKDIEVSYEDTQDPSGINHGKEYYLEFSRDPCRSPMQWTSSTQAGFTTSPNPWLPVHNNCKTVNVEDQQISKSFSPLKLYRKLAFLREHPSFQTGALQYVEVNKNILSYVRGSAGKARFLVAMNFGHESSTDDYNIHPVNSDEGSVVVTTSSLKDEETKISLKRVLLSPGSGIIVKL